MFINFKEGQCHFCGDRGNEIEKGIFQCKRCNTLFHSFGFSPYTEIKDMDEKFWQ